MRELGEGIVPLRRGAATGLCRALAGSAVLPGFRGRRDASGRAAAAVVLSPGALGNPALLDREHLLAFVTRRGFASNAVTIRLDT